jgi:hypothetical protein
VFVKFRLGEYDGALSCCGAAAELLLAAGKEDWQVFGCLGVAASRLDREVRPACMPCLAFHFFPDYELIGLCIAGDDSTCFETRDGVTGCSFTRHNQIVFFLSSDHRGHLGQFLSKVWTVR